jgi:4-hydroxybenzoyl-CoA reductase subunit alpha
MRARPPRGAAGFDKIAAMVDTPRKSINRTHGPDAPHGEFHVVGKRVRKVDGIHKATGQAVYADDIALPGMLHAKTLRSPHAHALIRGIDASAALALPGVHAVITGRDLPITYGVIPWTQDENALAVDKVRFVGDEVACVAAVDEDTANAALKLIRVDYEVLEAFLDPQKALRQGSPAIHDNGRPASGGKPAVPASNISKHVRLDFGDVDAALAASALVVEDDYEFHGTAHAPIEPHCAVAQVDGNGVVTLWSSTQIPHYVHRALARVLQLPAHRIRVIQPNLGGAFGGKSDPFYFEFCACLLALRTGRPVKFLLTREETFYTHRGRHPMQMRFRTGCDARGLVTAVDSRILIDGGSYSSFGLVTTYYSGQLLCGPTHFPTYRFDSTRVFTNKPPCGPKRGHGSVQPRFALEIQLDRLATQLGIDPIEFRRRNCLPANTPTVNGQLVTSNGFLQCLDAVERASGWKDKRGKLGAAVTPDGRRVLRGIGVAGSMYISGTNYSVYPNDMPQSGIMVRLDRSGLAMVYAGTSDIGQGSNSVMAMIVAEELGLRLDQVRVVAADSDLTPVDLGAYSSRITLMAGNAAVDAARKLRLQVQAAVGEKLGIPPQQVLLADGFAFDREDPGSFPAPDQAHARGATAARGATTTRAEADVPMPSRCLTSQQAFQLAEAKFESLSASGSYNTPERGGDYRGGTIGASPAYSFTAHVAEVEVDVETGEVRVPKVWIAHDCGRAISPVQVEGQIEGSTYMGVAEALLESHEVYPEFTADGRGAGGAREAAAGANSAGAGAPAVRPLPEAGLHMRPSLLEYTIPTTLDTPEMEALIVESIDPEGPYGAKEAGEGPLHGSLPAIANALFDATGVWFTKLPFTPGRVLAALRAAEVR